MKKLNAILIFLIVLYVSINVVAGGLNTFHNLTDVDFNKLLHIGGDDEDAGINVGTSAFAEIENFTANQTNDTIVSLYNSQHNTTITVEEIESSQNLQENVNSLISAEDTAITSNQTISQNGITAYFLYEETEDTYNADIYFSKEDKNYFISGENISYDDSDFFINTCKEIINSMGADGSIHYSRY